MPPDTIYSPFSIEGIAHDKTVVFCHHQLFPTINRALNEKGWMANIVKMAFDDDALLFTITKMENKDAS